MDRSFLEKYARVILTAGVHLKPGQKLNINAEPIHWEFAAVLAEQAYQMGASYVRVDAQHPWLTKARVDFSPDESLEYVPSFQAAIQDTMLKEDWALVTLDGGEMPHLLDSVDKDRLARMRKAHSIVRRPFMNKVLAGALTWCIAGVPTAAWADEVFKDRKIEGDKVDALWKALIPILRLDKADPVAAWKQHSESLKHRCRWLNKEHFDSLHFTGPGTDLHVGLNERSVWEGGVSSTTDKWEFMPNLPTEEVFTTPNFRRTEGRVTCTKPVSVMGTIINRCWFEFREGRVVNFGASEHEQVLANFLKTDEGSSFLGEVALVGADSPISQSGLVFHEILFDENAACHIALGSGYPDAIEGGTKMSAEELQQAGCNDSLVHIDFMIGSEEVSVTGVRKDGSRQEIIRNGVFVLPS